MFVLDMGKYLDFHLIGTGWRCASIHFDLISLSSSLRRICLLISLLCATCAAIYIIFIYICIYIYIVFLLFTIFGVEFDSQIELKSQKLVAHGSNAICLVARCRFGTVTTVLVAVVVLVAAAATVVVAAATANTYTFLPLFCCCRAHIFSLANFSCFF